MMPLMEKAPKSGVSKAAPEERVSSLLDQLPEEIADRWDEEHADLSDEERLKHLTAFLEKRKKTLAKTLESNRDPSQIEVVQMRPLAVMNLLEEIERGTYEELGVGKAGRVIASVRQANMCYKVMFPLDRVPQGTNDVSVETDLQEEVSRLGEIAGVRVPKVFYFAHEGEDRAIAMERLHADTLRDIFHGKAEVPETFSLDRFFSALEEYVHEMHANGYYHRDLHDGNIMVDRESGMPRVIDFGMATHSHFPDDVYRIPSVKNGQRIETVLPSDLDGVQLARQRMASFLRSKQGGV